MNLHPLRDFAMNLSEFQQKIAESRKPVVVDFWAVWCVPCRVTKPILEKLAREYSDKVTFLPIDADVSREVVQHFGVIGIPTVLTIRNGDVIGRVTGARKESEYRAMFEALAQGGRVELPLPIFDRALRLGSGLLFAVVGFSTSVWWMVALGGILGFLGVYDRCPVWTALTKMLRHSA